MIPKHLTDLMVSYRFISLRMASYGNCALTRVSEIVSLRQVNR